MSNAPDQAEVECRGGSPEACFSAGGAYLLGQGARPDEDHAAELFRRACDLGSGRGCRALAFLHARSGDTVEAVRLFERSCSSGTAQACGDAAGLVHWGFGAGDPPRGAALNEVACLGGSAVSCTRLANQMWLGDGVSLEPGDAMRLVDALCEREVGVACAKRAEFTAMDELPEPKKRRRAYLRKGCEAKDAGSCVLLGLLYRYEKPREAIDYLLRGCRLGDINGCGSGVNICGPSERPFPECRELQERFLQVPRAQR